MADDLARTIGGILAGLLGIAIVAVILSGKSQTSNVIGAASSAFAKIVSAAVAPVSTGGSLPSAVTPENTAFVTSGSSGGGIGGMISPASFVSQSGGGGGDGIDTASNVIGTIGKVAGMVAMFA